MVRTDQLWRYVRTIKVQYDGDDGQPVWSTLLKVTPSEYQGWSIHLEDGTKLQSCFGEIEWEVRVLWHEDVLTWRQEV